MMSVINDPVLARILNSLHAKSDAQLAAIRLDREQREKEGRPEDENPELIKAYLSDKLVALDRDKAEFCYQLLRATNARRVVEVGTSYGVSTLYLAAALRDNVEGTNDTAIVIGTEYEPGKVAATRRYIAEAGLADFVHLLEGDLRETLRDIDGPIDFVLIDIWISMARPALELVARHLRPGAIVVCDNTELYRDDYADYFAFINDLSKNYDDHSVHRRT